VPVGEVSAGITGIGITTIGIAAAVNERSHDVAKTATTIAIRDLHRREYRRTMRLIAASSVILWFVMAILLAGNHAGSAILPVSIIMLVGLAVIRISLWSRYRRDLRAELAGQSFPQGEGEG
jgi:hypothetical protein